MASSYGYTTPNYGYYRPAAQKAPTVQTRALAMAAAQRAAPTPNNPFGIGSGATSFGFDVGDGSIIKPPAMLANAAAAPVVAPASAPAAAPATTPAVSPTAQTAASNASSGFDINTDPQFASAASMLGQSDEQANASALKQRKDVLLGYGDSNLAQKLLGDSTLAQAAGKNPTSTLAQLAQGRDRTIHDLTEGLNKQNLLYGGYRVTQEQQAGQDYQNQLASAAAAVNGQLGGIDSQLGQALGSNQQARIAAMNASYDRNKMAGGASPADAAAATGGGTTGDGSLTDPLGGAGNTPTDDLRAALALAARTHRMGFV